MVLIKGGGGYNAARGLILQHSPCKMFTAFALQNVCSIYSTIYLQHPSCKCLLHQPCKMFAASTLLYIYSIHPANVCCNHPAKSLQHPPCKMFSASNRQSVCSISLCKMFAVYHSTIYLQHPPYKCLLHPPCKIFAPSTLQYVCSIHPADILFLHTFNVISAFNPRNNLVLMLG